MFPFAKQPHSLCTVLFAPQIDRLAFNKKTKVFLSEHNIVNRVFGQCKLEKKKE